MFSTTVIICTRNRPQDVELCLPSVLAAAQRVGADVLLVDQSTDDKTRHVVRAMDAPCLTYLGTDTVGKSVALNLALNRMLTRTDIDLLAFTDDDCEVSADWLERYAVAFAADPGADILFGPVTPSPAIPNVDEVCVPSWTFTEARDLLPGEVCGMGANMALRRSALARLGDGPTFFDPLLGPGAPFPAGEEGDFVYRLRRTGARAALRPEIGVEHRAFRLPEHWQRVLGDYGRGDAAFYGKHARCGDGWAQGVLRKRLTAGTVRGLAKWVLGRKRNDDLSYVRGLRAGLRAAQAYAVDPGTRLFLTPAAPAVRETEGVR